MAAPNDIETAEPTAIEPSLEDVFIRLVGRSPDE